MPRLSKKFKDETQFFINPTTGKRQFNLLCQHCIGHCKQLYHERYLISKESFSEFLSSKPGQDIVQKSEIHKNVIEQFMAEQKNSGMELTMSL